ncbi:MAG: MarR family transcriptional regulator [Bacilli bacterium]|nr:MarR family transcriptional regulator [Bacilli bacterium]
MEERFEMFTVLIAKSGRLVKRIKTEEMAEFNLKLPHVSCIYYLYKRGTLTSKELCDICDEDKASISRALEHLEENGYIRCLDEAKKRYKSPLELTEKGKIVGEKVEEKIDNILVEASKGLTPENRKIFYESFSLICNNLQNIYNNYEKGEKNEY